MFTTRVSLRHTTMFTYSHANKSLGFAEISRKFSAVRWFNETEDCIFPRSFILRSNVQSFNILPSFNLTIYLAVFSQSIAIHNLFKTIYYIYRIVFIYLPFSEVHTPLRVSEISSELILYITSPLYLFSLRLIQLNVCHILTRIIKVFIHVPAIPARLF